MNFLTSSFEYFSTSLKLSALTEEEEGEEPSAQQIIDDISSDQPRVSLNDWLLQYSEIRTFSEYTGIQPKYIVYVLSFFLILLMINYFSKAFTLFVGVIYPIRCSIKELRSKNKKAMRKWLEYWVVFFLFFNIETVFGQFFEKIPMYLFYKMIFLLVCFLPWYDGAHYIYNTILREWFITYEKLVYKYSKRFAKKISKQIYKEE